MKHVKKSRSLAVVIVLCLMYVLSACTTDMPIEEVPEMTTAATTEHPTMATTEHPATATTEPATIPSTTVPPTIVPVREIGPDKIEGNAVTIENVSVDFVDDIPQNIKASSTYSICGFKDEFVLGESQVYAAIHFTVTNQTGEEIKIADVTDDFLVELIYDDRYVFSPDGDSWCFFLSGSKLAVVSAMAGVGSVKQSPLATNDVTVYIPCAKEVSTEQEKHLSVVFSTNYSGFEVLEFNLR